MVTASSGSSIAGSVYSLVCTVKVVDGLVVVPDVMWMKDGRVLVDEINATLTRVVSPSISVLNLTFVHLLLSNRGLYTCVAAINISELFLSSNNDTNISMTVESKC